MNGDQGNRCGWSAMARVARSAVAVRSPAVARSARLATSTTHGARFALVPSIAAVLVGLGVALTAVLSATSTGRGPIVRTIHAQGELVTASVRDSTDDAGRDVLDACRLSVVAQTISLGRCADDRDIVNGFRFRDVPIPARAIITSARLVFKAEESAETGLSLVIDGEYDVAPLAFTEGALPWPIDRPRTPSDVAWVVPLRPAWESGRIVRSSDLSPVVQEIVDLPLWTHGNSMMIRVSTSGPASGAVKHRLVRSADHPDGGAPSLEVTYEIPYFVWLPWAEREAEER